MYRKFTADNIFTGYRLLTPGHVLITNTAGTIIDMVTAADAGDNIQHFTGMLCPGFINTHCHLELSHMKGHIPEHTGLVDFVIKVISERHFSDEEIFDAIDKADTYMYESGIVAVGDICNNTLTIPQKQKSKIRYYNFIETSGFPPSVAAARFEKSVGYYNEYKKLFKYNAIVPHAPYSVSPDLFTLMDGFHNKVITIHNQETAAENELFEKGTGDFLRLYERLGIDISFFKPSRKSSLQTYLPYLKNYESLILVHNVHTSESDVAFQQQSMLNNQRSTFYCICPNANLYISNALPDVDVFLQPPSGFTTADGVSNIVLGTDSLASNHQLSIMEEIKTLHKHFPALSIETLLQWATINGARALQMDDELGSFEKGKTPGIILIENAAGLKNTTSRRLL